jgi:hypothetical protein
VGAFGKKEACRRVWSDEKEVKAASAYVEVCRLRGRKRNHTDAPDFLH